MPESIERSIFRMVHESLLSLFNLGELFDRIASKKLGRDGTDEGSMAGISHLAHDLEPAEVLKCSNSYIPTMAP